MLVQCRHAMLVVYNLQNGVSMVRANGYDARVSNGDAGQQWVLDRDSFTSTSRPFTEALTIEVIDRNGAGDGILYYLLLDTDVFDADCAPGSGLNASPAAVLSACHDSCLQLFSRLVCNLRCVIDVEHLAMAGKMLHRWCNLHDVHDSKSQAHAQFLASVLALLMHPNTRPSLHDYSRMQHFHCKLHCHCKRG